MGYGRAEKACSAYKFWPANPGLCGRCAWTEGEHQEIAMKPHQQRVVDEMKELNIKRDKLTEFIKGDLFKTLDDGEQSRLNRQLFVMGEYAGILAERIVHFSA